jgi:hypothetical protein
MGEKNSFQLKEDTFLQHIRLIYTEVTSKVLRMEYSFVWC